MKSPTRGHDRTKISKSVVNQIFALRREGYTCAQIAKMTNTGESTVARYTSDWYQKEKRRGFVAHRGVHQNGKETNRIVAPKDYAEEVATPPVVNKKEQFSPEVIDYINKIYLSGNVRSGTFIGNLFIRIGKFLGGHDSV
jgi:hypothetical protein